jgi:hypothetical protein
VSLSALQLSFAAWPDAQQVAAARSMAKYFILFSSSAGWPAVAPVFIAIVFETAE